MKNLRLLIMIMVILPLTIPIYSDKGENSDNEGVPDDKNHPGTVASIREYKRADRELNVAYKMLMEAYDDDTDAKRKLKSAQLAWLEYRDLASASETSLYIGGHPEQQAWNNSQAELTRERIARLRKMLESIYEEKNYNRPNDELTLKIKKMLDEIKKMDAEAMAKHKKDLEGTE